MLSEKMSIRLLKYLLLPVLVGVFSIAVCAKTVPNSKFVQSTLESIEDSKMTVMEFEGATLAASVAITLLPDDTATPIADNFAKIRSIPCQEIHAFLLFSINRFRDRQSHTINPFFPYNTGLFL